MHAVTEQDGMFLLGFVASQRLFVRDKILLSSPQFCSLVFANKFMSKLILVLGEELVDIFNITVHFYIYDEFSYYWQTNVGNFNLQGKRQKN